MENKLSLEIVTSERTVYSGDVDMVTVPGGDGVMGILPRHAPVLSTLKPGELKIKHGAEEQYFAIGGGFLNVAGNKVIILADSAERSDEIDLARAESARGRATDLLKNPPSDAAAMVRIEQSMRKHEIRMRVARRHRGSYTPGEQ